MDPTGRHTARLKSLTLAARAALAIMLFVGASGCSASFRTSREGPSPYQTEIPGEISVMAAIAASEQTLRAWGYSIEADQSTETRGRVLGRDPERRALGFIAGDSVEISAKRNTKTTLLRINQSATDADEARLMLRDVRIRLGLPY
jgi:hypothetical protein